MEAMKTRGHIEGRTINAIGYVKISSSILKSLKTRENDSQNNGQKQTSYGFRFTACRYCMM